MTQRQISYIVCFMLLMLFFSECRTKKDSVIVPVETMYFPPNNSAEWETSSHENYGWNREAAEALKSYLIEKNTRSFMILVNGRIVMEEYFNGHTKDSVWKWNSAGKTLVTAATGIAQEEGLINIEQPVSTYLGTGWTSETADKEILITSRSLLTMTSGINDASNLVIKPNLTYLADAGTRWSYHNVFQKLMDVIAEASNQDYEDYFNAKLRDRIGMDGYWNKGIIFTIYNSTTRSMARFGLLALNKGNWNGTQIVSESYFNESINTSQSINPSYGYMWWLNGKSSYMLPDGQTVYTGTLVPNAPSDMYAAMGAQDQRIYVIPGKNMVVVRMGEASDLNNPNFAVSGFDNELWGKINAVIQ